MDTTLRDGEQTGGVSYTADEKLNIAVLLLQEVKVDRIEVASARVSEGEFDAVRKITKWAKENKSIDKVEVLTFVDGGVSIDWMIEAGAKVQNLLTKGSLNHLTYQLKKTPEQHFQDIENNIKYAISKGVESNIYLEDWSNGMKNSQLYVFSFLDFLQTQSVKRVMLPDTLGVLCPSEVYKMISQIVTKYPNLHFDFHAHNDYDLSVANVLEAIKAGIHGIHTTINGMGERAGNAPLASSLAAIHDFLPNVKVKVQENAMFSISKIIESFSGIRVPHNKPIVGENVFTQTAGIHADGDKKKNLYFNDLLPERFGRTRKYALGKTSGKANIAKNLQELGIVLNDEQIKLLTEKVIQLGDKKELITQEDLPYLISDILEIELKNQRIKILNFSLNHAQGLTPTASLKLNIDNIIYEAHSGGDGQYDAFFKAMKSILKEVKIPLPDLTDYSVRIPPGGNTDALCETVITWQLKNKTFKTKGLDSDQTVSAIIATERMLNIIL
jgi:D-citramalate synthase